MIEATIFAEFSDDKHSPNWLDGESFTYRGFLPAVPPIDSEIGGVFDHDRRSYVVKVHRVEMTIDNATVRVYGMVI